MWTKDKEQEIINFDFASLYPTCMKVYDIDEAKIKRELRKLKLNKIFKDEDVS